MKRFLTSLVLVTLLSPFASASETVKGAKKDFEEFKKEMSVKLDTAEKKIEELRVAAKVKGNQTQEKLAVELEQAKNNLKKQQADLKYESETGWKRVKQSFSEAADNLNAKIQKALKE